MATVREDNLQLTLHSSASHKLYPANRANCFKTKLCKTLDFGGNDDWEVALMNIQYPVNWPNVLETTELAFIVGLPEEHRHSDIAPPMKVGAYYGMNEETTDALDVGSLLGDTFPTSEQVNLSNKFQRVVWNYMTASGPYPLKWAFVNCCTISRGHYSSIVEIGQYIEKRFYELFKPFNEIIKRRSLPPFKIEFSYDRYNNIARFFGDGPGQIHIVATSDYLLSTLFGFQPYNHAIWQKGPVTTKLKLFKTPIESTRSCALEHISSMCIYSDINKSQIIGDTEAPLLGIIPILSQSSGVVNVMTGLTNSAATGNINPGLESHEELRRSPGETQFYSVNPPYYLGITKNSFDTILLEIRTDWGDYFPFDEDPNSRIVCQLDFRRKASGNRSSGRFFL